jgi:LDH2 family malate/lactate/ureidoglycolate dehydrogenase
MDNWITRFRSAKTIDGQDRVLIHGDPERQMNDVRLEEGIPLNQKVEEDLQSLAAKFNIDF